MLYHNNQEFLEEQELVLTNLKQKQYLQFDMVNSISNFVKKVYYFSRQINLDCTDLDYLQGKCKVNFEHCFKTLLMNNELKDKQINVHDLLPLFNNPKFIKALVYKNFHPCQISNDQIIMNQIRVGLKCFEIYLIIKNKEKFFQHIKESFKQQNANGSSNIENSEFPLIKQQNCRCKQDQKCNEADCPCYRDYCFTESCLCNPKNCTRIFQGCQCYPDTCQSNDKCPCFREKSFCDPQVCFSCFQQESVLLQKNSIDQQNPIPKCLNKIDFSMISKMRFGLGQSDIPNSGLGLFTLQNIQKGDCIGVYTGEFVDQSNDEFQYERRSFYREFKAPSYIFDFSDGGFTDAKSIGNLMRYINHLDIKTKKVNVDSIIKKLKGQNVILFRAKSDIKSGQELYLNYGSKFFNLKSENYDDIDQDQEMIDECEQIDTSTRR
ncbi:polycomblike protein [Stylonychia lemnae]|uniref:Polycomblike protein n=1 Tax=Stylonychia lemnae TaxID=5949 RepID=A0A078A4V9_STYLE|nr:polycomblike protein [Stylonychia lemnae]|eukprot:CDW77300.1 polycomblike protein [Stylonychia lemnae]